jgi:hypothetical protein
MNEDFSWKFREEIEINKQFERKYKRNERKHTIYAWI